MRGAVPVELMAAVILGAVVAGVFFMMFFTKADITTARASVVGGVCEAHTNCQGDPDGKLCLSINSGPRDCGCLENADCPSNRCNTVTNRCFG